MTPVIGAPAPLVYLRPVKPNLEQSSVADCDKALYRAVRIDNYFHYERFLLHGGLEPVENAVHHLDLTEASCITLLESVRHDV